MGKYTMIPQDTFGGLQLNAGILLRSFDPETGKEPSASDIICATSGGLTISCSPSFSDMGAGVDNAPVNVKELMKLDSWTCTMSFDALTTSIPFLKLALGCADADATKVTPRRDLKQTDFTDIWWVGDRADGGMVAVHLMNALSTGGISLKTNNNGTGQTSVTLTGHVSVDAQDVVPMEFYSSAAIENEEVTENGEGEGA